MEYTALGARKAIVTLGCLRVQPVGTGKSPFHFPCISTHGIHLEYCSSPIQVRPWCAGMRLMEVTSGQGARALNLQEETEQVMVFQPEKENPRGKSYCCPQLPDQRISRS